MLPGGSQEWVTERYTPLWVWAPQGQPLHCGCQRALAIFTILIDLVTSREVPKKRFSFSFWKSGSVMWFPIISQGELSRCEGCSQTQYMSFLYKGVSSKSPRTLQAGSWDGRKASGSCQSCWNSYFTAGESLQPDSGGGLSFLPRWGVSLTPSVSTLPPQSTLFSGPRGSIHTDKESRLLSIFPLVLWTWPISHVVPLIWSSFLKVLSSLDMVYAHCPSPRSCLYQHGYHLKAFLLTFLSIFFFLGSSPRPTSCSYNTVKLSRDFNLASAFVHLLGIFA